MTLKLFFHPLSSFCQKALIALYENDTAFEPVPVNLGDPVASAPFRALWPMAKIPVLRDEARGHTLAETPIIIEYLDLHYPGPTRFLPRDAERALEVRFWDRFFDHFVQYPMQKIVTDALRPAGGNDPPGVEQARAQLRQAYAVIEERLPANPWACGEAFSLADCAAAPALFYANTVLRFGAEQRRLAGYLARLKERPSYARALREAEPFFKFFPLDPKPQL